MHLATISCFLLCLWFSSRWGVLLSSLPNAYPSSRRVDLIPADSLPSFPSFAVTSVDPPKILVDAEVFYDSKSVQQMNIYDYYLPPPYAAHFHETEFATLRLAITLATAFSKTTLFASRWFRKLLGYVWYPICFLSAVVQLQSRLASIAWTLHHIRMHFLRGFLTGAQYISQLGIFSRRIRRALLPVVVDAGRMLLVPLWLIFGSTLLISNATLHLRRLTPFLVALAFLALHGPIDPLSGSVNVTRPLQTGGAPSSHAFPNGSPFPLHVIAQWSEDPYVDALVKQENVRVSFVQTLTACEFTDRAGEFPGSKYFMLEIPVNVVCDHLNKVQLEDLLLTHIGVKISKARRYRTLANLRKAAGPHSCARCDTHFPVFSFDNLVELYRTTESSSDAGGTEAPPLNLNRVYADPTSFPPDALGQEEQEDIIRNWCADTDPNLFKETGCAVCCQLVPLVDSTPFDSNDMPWRGNLLHRKSPGSTRKERFTPSDPVSDLTGSILGGGCSVVCNACREVLLTNKIPSNALCNGLWLGEVPDQLKGLSFAEEMTIQKIRPNRCVVRVALSGRSKMSANAILYPQPMLKICNVLPPPRADLDEVLCIVFSGVSNASVEDRRRTPFLIRRDKVALALDWLKLNHRDYADVVVSQDNLDSYVDNDIPVHVKHHKTQSADLNKVPLATSIHDRHEDEGTDEGPCTFVVHGITGTQYSSRRYDEQKAVALAHLQNVNGSTLIVGQAEKPVSMYDNPNVYPQIFPWLFPYGLGGLNSKACKRKLNEQQHKRWLLLYHDKRFQEDRNFPMIAFNHLQIKSAVTGSVIMAKKKRFPETVKRIQSVDKNIWIKFRTLIEKGEHIDVAALTVPEKNAWKILGDIDQIGNRILGSSTSKKYMNNEIWSLTAFHGAPSWFITISPADHRHPIALYYADHDIEVTPDIRSERLRFLLSSRNPVSGARFFDYMSRMFLKHFVGVGSTTRGMYGDASAYYGTVEQQGRLTLHLHLLLWIKGALAPEEVRDMIKIGQDGFETSLLEYLEACHDGEYATGTHEEVVARHPLRCRDKLFGTINDEVFPQGESLVEVQDDSGYRDPTKTLPTPPPSKCITSHHNAEEVESCSDCKLLTDWRAAYNLQTDDLRAKLNRHNCIRRSAASNAKGCLNSEGVCQARFPKDILHQSSACKDDGFIKLRHIEPWQNRITASLTYVLRCNTDVSSLSSGTAIKGVIAYVTDYISKAALKSHHIFSTAWEVFDRNPSLTDGSNDPSASTRALIMKLVNALGPKMEIGSPMACLYLLGNPDHYTGSTFPLFWWKSYVDECYAFWTDFHQPVGLKGADVDLDEDTQEPACILTLLDNRFVGSSRSDDYVHRPSSCEALTLYEWSQSAQVTRRKPGQITKFNKITGGRNLGEDIHPGTLAPRGEKDETGFVGISYSFRPTHPLYQTTFVTVDVDKIATHVPNLVGATLPRRDQGNREYYCCAMLTFFKPWRVPLDLKRPDETWQEAFQSYPFLPRPQRLMRNFNLRYECLDERHNFKSLLKRKQNGLDDDYYSNMQLDDEMVDDAFGTVNDYMQEDSTWSRYKALHEEMGRVAITAGWFDRPADSPEIDREDFFIPDDTKTPTQWKNLVVAAKVLEADSRSKIAANNRAADESPHKEFNKAIPDEVKIVENKYFSKLFRAASAREQRFIDEVVVEDNLSSNVEQERAFRLVANHISSDSPQLKMYLGGMGGTGKSKVLDALTNLFKKRNELYRFAVVAPTGSAAALLNGTTYHHLFGINGNKEEASGHEGVSIATAKARLMDVDYIFLDEISMVSANELHIISTRLCKIMGNDEPFGGLNFIVAGDFAQLAPPIPGSATLYNEYVATSIQHPQDMSVREQSSILGKALWHQFTTVVILRKNMRQTSQTPDDAKLRSALEHMRYGACDASDITFLNSLVASRIDGRRNAGDPMFRHVSVITTVNNDKDALNAKGTVQFAADTKQIVKTFYSRDSLATDNDSKPVKGKKGGKSRKRISGGDHPSLQLQTALWSGTPSRSDHVPATLGLCVGLPVLIRFNDATELCITKGQEATVVGWVEGSEYYDMPTLDTVFVELKNPKKPVRIEGLPLNVVPINRCSTKVKARTPHGAVLDVHRQQVKLLPNFAMTDFSAQGKSREVNVVYWGNCRTIHNFYTSLSRGTSAKGTLILNSFDGARLQRGIQGGLRQEFRELDMLDEITELTFNDQLPSHIQGNTRNLLLRSYQLHKGPGYRCSRWDPALKSDPIDSRPIPVQEEQAWFSNITVFKATEKGTSGKTTSRVPASNMAVDDPSKRKRTGKDDANSGSATRGVGSSGTRRNQRTLGFVWDSVNWSCPYDAFLIVLWAIWSDDRARWSSVYNAEGRSSAIKSFARSLPQIVEGFAQPEIARNEVRECLVAEAPDSFPTGRSCASIGSVAENVMNGTPCMSLSWYCPTCRSPDLRYTSRVMSEVIDAYVTENSVRTVQQAVEKALSPRSVLLPCANCNLEDVESTLVVSSRVESWPDVLVVSLLGNSAAIRVGIDNELTLSDDNVACVYNLRGVSYFQPGGGTGHFVCRTVTEDGKVYFNDGAIDKQISRLEGTLDTLPPNHLDFCVGGYPSLVTYTRDPL